MRSPGKGLLLSLLLTASIGALPSCSGSGSGPAPEHPDITGTWIVNMEESDKPGDQMQRRRPAGAPPGRPGSGGERRERMQIGLAVLLQNSVAFKIEEGDSTLTLTGAEGLTRTFYPDGQERERRIEGLGITQIKARWKGDKFVVERSLEGGVKITETFELAEGGRRLHIKLKVAGGRGTIDFRRVYDAADDKL